MLYLERPENFSPKFSVSSCFIEHDGKILLLHRQDYKPQGNTWAVPAGKIEKGETAAQAIAREIREEIGLSVEAEALLPYQVTFVKYDEYDFTYEMHKLVLPEKPQIVLEPDAHKDFLWVTPEEALKMNLIQDEDACIKLCYFS